VKFHCSINADEIVDEDALHDVFARALGFPAFYGRNWNAWIDCMSCLDEPECGMSKITVAKGNLLTLRVVNTESFRKRLPSIFSAFIECAAFVNYRRTERGDNPVLALVLE
jgi:hypothetical protein